MAVPHKTWIVKTIAGSHRRTPRVSPCLLRRPNCLHRCKWCGLSGEWFGGPPPSTINYLHHSPTDHSPLTHSIQKLQRVERLNRYNYGVRAGNPLAQSRVKVTVMRALEGELNLCCFPACWAPLARLFMAVSWSGSSTNTPCTPTGSPNLHLKGTQYFITARGGR